MNPDDIAADLPAPRDDEPESLRRDIVDELADHLQCALNRELLATEQASGRREPADFPNATNTEQTAWQHVLTRFGSPSAIARQLWLDAMKERIMAQKLTATMATLAVVACVVMCMLLWRTSLTQSHLQSRLEEQRALNASLMADLKSMLEDSSRATTNAGWAPVKVHLQSENGEPVAGRVGIQGTAINAGNDNEINVHRSANKEGVADFGLLPFGNYEMQVTATDLEEEHRQSFMLSPNTPAEQTIVCPTEPPPAVEVSFAIDVPPPLHADRLVFFAAFNRSPRKMSSGTWHVESTDDRRFNVLIDAEGTILGEVSNTKVIEDDSRTFGASVNPAAADFLRESGRGPSDVTRRYEGRLVPARSIRATDRCVGLGVAALPADHVEDGTTFRYVLATWPYTAEEAEFEAFPDTDSSEQAMRIEFNPPSSFWEMVVAAFRRSEEVADVTIPEGWQVVKVPANPRNLLRATKRSQFDRGRSLSQPPPESLRLMVVATLPDQSGLTLGVGEPMRSSRLLSTLSSSLRRKPEDTEKFDVDILVSPELAEAIELARSVGTVEAVRLSDEDSEDIDENGVNQQTLKTLRELAAEQPAAKDE